MAVDVPGLEIGEVLSRRDGSVTHAGRDVDLDRGVTVTVVRPGRMKPADFSRLYDECRIPGVLSKHPNIVAVHDVTQAVNGEGCIISERYHGGSLADLLATRVPSQLEAFSIGVQIADAIRAAHALGVVHGDLMAEDVLFAADGETVGVSGFGLRRFLHPDVPPTEQDDVYILARLIGSLGLQPIERAKSAREVLDALLERGAPPPPSMRGRARTRRFDLDWRSPEVLWPAAVLVLALIVFALIAAFGQDDAPDDPGVVGPVVAVPDDLVIVDERDSVTLRWTDPAGDQDFFLVEAPRDGLRRIIGPLERGSERYDAEVDPRNGYCYWIILPVEGERPTSDDDLVHKSNPVCVRGALPDYP